MPTEPLTQAAALLVSFACLSTIHLVLAVSLIRHRTPTWQGFLVLLPPLAWLAPYWGFREGKKWLSVLWLLSGAAYCITLLGALRA